MSLDANITVGIEGKHTNPLDLGTAEMALKLIAQSVFTDGAGAGQVNQLFSDKRNLAASGTEDLDLSGTALQNAFGVNIAFARIKAILVKALSGNTNNVNVTRPAANGVPLFLAAGDGLALQPGGFFLWVAPTAAGVVVTAGIGDLLTFTNSAGGSSVDYEVAILGALT